MPDDNRFAGLSDADDGADDEPDEQGDETETEDGGPAFEFEATSAKSIYVRPETLELLEDAEFEVESALRREHGVRDVTGREFHDAAVRVLADHADEIVDHILEEREQD